MNSGNFHYSQLIESEFSKRREKNQKYSLRAFARDLGMEPAQLSRVLRRQRNISLQTARSISVKLFSGKAERALFIDLVSLALAKKPSEAELLRAQIEKRRRAAKMIDLTWLAVISDWFHIAIMDLLTLPNAPRSAAEIAAYLGVPVSEASRALERLDGLRLVRSIDGVLRKSDDQMITPSGVPSAAIRRYHKQMIEKAALSLDTQPIGERLVFGRTMTIRKRDLARLEQMMKEFLEEAAELSEEMSCDSLYQINLQAFNLKATKRGAE